MGEMPDFNSTQVYLLYDYLDHPQKAELLKRVIEKTPSELRGGFINYMLPAMKKSFQLAANAYRRRNCDGKAKPLHYGEIHYGCHNFTGPGTVMEGKKPYNCVDNCARKHDKDYGDAKGDLEKVRKADEEFLKCVDQYKNQHGYRAARYGIGSKVKAEDLIKNWYPEYSLYSG
jgi:hypothetical protein